MFLELLRETASVKASARRVGISRQAAYKARARSEGFREAWEDALEEAIDDLEAEARRRALEGTEIPVFYDGGEVGTRRVYSDTLLIFLLKGRRREIFGDRTEVTTSKGKEIETFTLSSEATDENHPQED